MWKKKLLFNWNDSAAVDQNLKVLSCSRYIMSGYYRQLILIDMIATQPTLDKELQWIGPSWKWKLSTTGLKLFKMRLKYYEKLCLIIVVCSS